MPVALPPLVMRPRARTLPSADSESRHEFEPLQWEEQATGGLFADALSGGDAQTMQRERGRLLNYGIPACCCFMIIGVIVGVNSLTSVIEEQGVEAHRIANLESPSPPPWPPHTPPGTSQAFNVDVEVSLLSTALASSDEVASVTMLGTLATAVAAVVPGATVELQAITNRRRALADVGRRLDPYDYTCGGHCTTNADCNDAAQTSLVTYRVVIVLPTLSEAQSLALRTAIQNAISQLKVDTGGDYLCSVGDNDFVAVALGPGAPPPPSPPPPPISPSPPPPSPSPPPPSPPPPSPPPPSPSPPPPSPPPHADLVTCQSSKTFPDSSLVKSGNSAFQVGLAGSSTLALP